MAEHDYEIVRFRQNTFATYSHVRDAHGQDVIVGIERPWLDADNDQRRDAGVSRFAPGLYKAVIRKSHTNGGTGKRNYDVWEFKSDDHDPATTDDTPDTQAAQVHVANFPWELEGCLGTGTAFGDVEYKGLSVKDGTHPREQGKKYPGVTASRVAFEKFDKDARALCAREKRDYLWIRVTDAFPP